MTTIDALVDTLRSAEAHSAAAYGMPMTAEAEARIRGQLERPRWSGSARWATALLLVASLWTSAHALDAAKRTSSSARGIEDAGGTAFDLGLADASAVRLPEGPGGPSALP